MKTMRMPKGWTLVGTNAMNFGDTETREEKQRRLRKLANETKKMAKRPIEKMEQDIETSYIQKTEYEHQLCEALNSGKLKSKSLIDKAKNLKEKDKENTAE